MSEVTTVMICGIGVYENAGKINLYLESKDHFGVDRINGGGEKPFGVDVLQGALNYLDLYSFIAFLESLKWEYPTDLFFMEEDDRRFTLRHLGEGMSEEESLSEEEKDVKLQEKKEKAISDVAKNRPLTPWKLAESTIIVGEEKEDTYGKYIDEKNKELDKEVEWIVEGAIAKVITASLASGVPCDPDTSDGINYIESCLDKMKKGEKNE